MYSIFVKFANGKKLLLENLTESVTRDYLKTGFKGVISYANVQTPSGCRKDVTNLLSNI